MGSTRMNKSQLLEALAKAGINNDNFEEKTNKELLDMLQEVSKQEQPTESYIVVGNFVHNGVIKSKNEIIGQEFSEQDLKSLFAAGLIERKES